MMPPGIMDNTTTDREQNICTIVHIKTLPLAELKFRLAMS